MKRKFLFRGKRIDNGEWVYGDLTQNPNVAIFENRGHCGENDVIPETVGQFTGLIDKNGKQIFEGDVIHHGDASELCLVTYIESGFYSVPTSKEKHTFSLEMWLSACVVIGNIFDNPELVSA